MLVPKSQIDSTMSWAPWSATLRQEDLEERPLLWSKEILLICRAFETANFILEIGRCCSTRDCTAQSRTRGRRRKDAPLESAGTHKDWMHDEAYMEVVEWYYYDQRDPSTPFCLEWCLAEFRAASVPTPHVDCIRANLMPLRRKHRRVEKRITDELTRRSVMTLRPLEVLRIQSARARGESIASLAERYNVGERRVETAIGR